MLAWVGHIILYWKSCEKVQRMSNLQQTTTDIANIRMGVSGRTWHRIQIEYARSLEGQLLLTIMDAHCEFIDAHVVSAET